MHTMEAMERAVLFFPSCLCCTLILKEIVNLAFWKMFQKIGMLWRISDLRIESAQRSFKSMHFKSIEIRVHLATFPLVPVFDDGFHANAFYSFSTDGKCKNMHNQNIIRVQNLWMRNVYVDIIDVFYSPNRKSCFLVLFFVDATTFFGVFFLGAERESAFQYCYLIELNAWHFRVFFLLLSISLLFFLQSNFIILKFSGN